MIKYIQGDLFDSNADIIAHGVNCRGAFGGGVAGVMAIKYPIVKDYYLGKYSVNGWKLGDIQLVTVRERSGYVANCATQDNYGTSKCHADYEAIKTAMTRLRVISESRKWSIAIPKIGAGLAGGNWNIIESIINEIFNDYDITVYYL